jgi:hypothetical protein
MSPCKQQLAKYMPKTKAKMTLHFKGETKLMLPKVKTPRPHRLFLLACDQTGAKDSRGLPKPLPAAVVQLQFNPFLIEEVACLSLAQLLPPQQLKDISINPLTQVWYILDTVLGLPKTCGRVVDHELFMAAKEYRHKHGLGLQAAHQFFQSLLPKREETKISEPPIHPRRRIEEELKAQSVFALTPYQRNIASGTYRIWSELADWNPLNYRIWPDSLPDDESTHPRVTLVEAYPSAIWSKRFAGKDPKRLFRFWQTHFAYELPSFIREKISQDPNWADSWVMATWATYLFLTKATIPDPHRRTDPIERFILF